LTALGDPFPGPQIYVYSGDLVLILFDFSGGFNNAILVEAGQHSHDDDTGLVAEQGPAEMRLLVENHETDDTDDEVDGAERQQ